MLSVKTKSVKPAIPGVGMGRTRPLSLPKKMDFVGSLANGSNKRPKAKKF